MASEMRAARSCARASWSRSAAGRPDMRGPVSKRPVFSVAGIATSPGNGVVGEVVQSPGHVLPEEVIQRQRSEEHTSELQSQSNLVCRLLLEKKKKEHHEPDDHNSTLR